MRLKSIRIVNYKGYADSGSMEIGEKWTVVVGRNNAGKSALLETFLTNEFQNRPHRNLAQNPRLPRNPNSSLYVSLEISGKELEETFLRHGLAGVDVPVSIEGRGTDFSAQFREAEFSLKLLTKGGGGGWLSERYPSHGLFVGGKENYSQRFVGSANRQSWSHEGLSRSSSDTVPALAGLTLADNTYVFKAERRVSGHSQLQDNLNLRPDAANLAGALNCLFTSNNVLYQEYFKLVREVLPEVQAMSIPPSGGGVEIRVWNSGYDQKRDDLAIPLDQCGTGIGQVLAILFVVVTASSGRVLVIDEPNSFLHPGASRVLIEVLRRFTDHQFVITTHSPDLIAAAQPDKLLVVRWLNDASNVDVYDGEAVAGVKAAFDELGVRLSDIFGFDAVIWVEGKTEAECFPIVSRSTGRHLPNRMAFVAVANTGSLDKLNADVLWDAYKALAAQSALAPAAVSISLDRERRTDEFCESLVRRSGGLMRFLPRRTYENYLLDPDAIAAVLTSENVGRPVVAQKISEWLSIHRLEGSYYRGMPRVVNGSEDWIVRIDAVRLLSDMIGDLTNHTQDYLGRKVYFAKALTSWLVSNKPESIGELSDYVRSLISEDADKSV